MDQSEKDKIQELINSAVKSISKKNIMLIANIATTITSMANKNDAFKNKNNIKYFLGFMSTMVEKFEIEPDAIDARYYLIAELAYKIGYLLGFDDAIMENPKIKDKFTKTLIDLSMLVGKN